MPSIHQIRGALLEEALLALLRTSRYRTVSTHEGDEFLASHRAGISVRGRGIDHQIDAIADHVVAHPFSNPQRLLVEAKNYDDRTRVGLDTIRSAVGVLKDVGEFAPPVPQDGSPPRRRYHYQYAVFSASGFTSHAQEYAFAHDVYLLPLAEVSRMGAVLRAIDTFADNLQRNKASLVDGVALGALRQQMRTALQPDLPNARAAPAPVEYPIGPIVEAVREVGECVVAVIAKALPVLLAPENRDVLDRLDDQTDVELWIDPHDRRRWSVNQWGGPPLFSFEVPIELFARYASAGAFDPQRALQIKSQYFREIQFVHMLRNRPRIVTLTLNGEWLREARRAVGLPPE